MKYSRCNLIRAIRQGNVIKASTLIDTFDLSHSKAWSGGYILLRAALQRKHRKIAKILLKHGSRVNSEKHRHTDTPLHFAVKNRDAAMVAMLLDRGANIDATNNCGQTPLHLSVRKYHFKIVSLLLDRNADVNARNYSGTTPLQYACIPQNDEIVKLLLKRGADINARNETQSTALHLAARMGCDEIVKVLLEHDGVDVDAEDDSGETVLNIAILQGHVPTIKNILAICPRVNNEKHRHCIRDAVYSLTVSFDNYEPNRWLIMEALLSHGFSIHPKDVSDLKLLHSAVEGGLTKIVEDFLQYGADVDSPYEEEKGYTLLHGAVISKQFDIAEILIKHGADVNAIDVTGKTPISYAIERIDAKMTKLLLSSGAEIKFNPDVLQFGVNRDAKEIIEMMLDHDVNYDIMAKGTSGQTALWHVMNSLNYYHIEQDLVELLLSRGAQVNAKINGEERILHMAVETGRDNMVEILLRYNADVNFATKIDMKTPLHCSVAGENEQISRVLLDAGAASNAKDKTGKTPLHYACEHKYNDKTVDMLLEFGAEIDDKDSKDSTPLHIAASTGSLKIVESLLKAFADAECTDKDGTTALHVASKHGFTKIVKELLDYGADPNAICKKGYSLIDYTDPGLFNYNEHSAERFFRFLLYELIYHHTHDDYGYDNENHSDFDRDGYYEFDSDDFKFESDHCNAGQTSDTLTQHMIKIKSLNIHGSERHFDFVKLNDKFADFEAKCEREVGLMKSQKIGETNISYYDVLLKSVNKLAVLSRNQDIVEDLESSRCGKKFSIYYKMLFYKFKKGQKRGNLLNASLKSFNFLSGFLLPEHASLQVLGMLKNKHLEILIKAVPET